MKKTKHTPGPWVYCQETPEDVVCVETGDGTWAPCGRSLPPVVEHQNALLIAAAPDLLSACKLALKELYAAIDSIGGVDDSEVARALREVIAKAEGGANEKT